MLINTNLFKIIAVKVRKKVASALTIKSLKPNFEAPKCTSAKAMPAKKAPAHSIRFPLKSIVNKSEDST